MRSNAGNKGTVPQNRWVFFYYKRELTVLESFVLGCVYSSGVQHPLAPKLQGLDSNRDLLLFSLYVHKVCKLITGDLTIHCDLNEPVLFSASRLGLQWTPGRSAPGPFCHITSSRPGMDAEAPIRLTAMDAALEATNRASGMDFPSATHARK